MNDNRNDIIALLRQIDSDGHCPAETARQLEPAMVENFPDVDDDKRLEDLMHILASYKPYGGEYMYGSVALIEECKRVLAMLES